MGVNGLYLKIDVLRTRILPLSLKVGFLHYSLSPIPTPRFTNKNIKYTHKRYTQGMQEREEMGVKKKCKDEEKWLVVLQRLVS